MHLKGLLKHRLLGASLGVFNSLADAAYTRNPLCELLLCMITKNYLPAPEELLVNKL